MEVHVISAAVLSATDINKASAISGGKSVWPTYESFFKLEFTKAKNGKTLVTGAVGNIAYIMKVRCWTLTEGTCLSGNSLSKTVW